MRDDEINKTALVPIVIPSYEPDDRLIALLEDFEAKGMGPVIIVTVPTAARAVHSRRLSPISETIFLKH